MMTAKEAQKVINEIEPTLKKCKDCGKKPLMGIKKSLEKYIFFIKCRDSKCCACTGQTLNGVITNWLYLAA